MSESRSTFVRQSAWMAGTTIMGSAFMTLVHPFAASLGREEYATFGALLRVVLLLAVPSAGLQIAFAQRAAAATPETEPALAAAARRVLGALTLLWLLLVAATVVYRHELAALFKLTDPRVLWPTLGAAWVSLTLPVFRGVLQGRQQFGAFGLSGVVDGACRFLGIAVLVAWLHGKVASAMTAACLASLLATGVVAWAGRDVWRGRGNGFAWLPFLRQAIPYSVCIACLLVLSQSDLIFLKAAIPAELEATFRQSYLYNPAAMIGFAMTQFTVPIALVMFPKIARSVARAEKTDALRLAFTGTVVLGALAAVAATLLPELPLRILFFRTPDNWDAAPMVPWCAWAMLAFALANVLVSHLFAREDFRIVPGLVALTLGFLATLWWLKPQLPGLEPFAAYRRVIGLAGGFNLALLAWAAWLTFVVRRPDRPAAAPAGAPAPGA